MFSNPYDTIYHLLAARSRGDSAAAMACYEPGAGVVVEPGKIETGEAAIYSLTETTVRTSVRFGGREIIEVDGIALHLSEWTVSVPAGPEISGRTIDVLRRQPDGSWLVLIDNPWGTTALGRRADP